MWHCSDAVGSYLILHCRRARLCDSSTAKVMMFFFKWLGYACSRSSKLISPRFMVCLTVLNCAVQVFNFCMHIFDLPNNLSYCFASSNSNFLFFYGDFANVRGIVMFFWRIRPRRLTVHQCMFEYVKCNVRPWNYVFSSILDPEILFIAFGQKIYSLWIVHSGWCLACTPQCSSLESFIWVSNWGGVHYNFTTSA